MSKCSFGQSISCLLQLGLFYNTQSKKHSQAPTKSCQRREESNISRCSETKSRMAILQNTSFASPIPSGSNNATKKSRRGLPPLRSPGIASPVPAKNNEKGTWGGKRICDNSATLPISSPLVRDNGHHAHEPDNNEMVMVDIRVWNSALHFNGLEKRLSMA